LADAENVIVFYIEIQLRNTFYISGRSPMFGSSGSNIKS